jgi:phosphoglycolate phosphatase-like HAD superfamily hydrolase
MKIDNVQAIIWDLDGTLMNSFAIFERVLSDVALTRGYTPPGRATMLENYHGTLEEAIQNALGLDSPEELAAATVSFLKLQEKHYKGGLEAHLFADACELARQAAVQTIPQLLVTNRDHTDRGTASPRSIVAATVLADYIHEIRAGDEVSFRKPDKRAVSDWLAAHALKPNQVLVIGDQFVDAQLAVNIGARALLVRRGDAIPHMQALLASNPTTITIVDNLYGIEISRST